MRWHAFSLLGMLSLCAAASPAPESAHGRFVQTQIRYFPPGASSYML